jgi:hypothetical protein
MLCAPIRAGDSPGRGYVGVVGVTDALTAAGSHRESHASHSES